MLQARHPRELSHLLLALAAFLAEHRGGELDGGADDGDGLWMVCEWGGFDSPGTGNCPPC